MSLVAPIAIPTTGVEGGTKSGSARKHGIFRSPSLHRWLRTFHRAGAVVTGVFMAIIGITGALISFDTLFPGAHGGRGFFSSTVHFTIMDFHTFFIFGRGPGLAIELLVTLALVFFCVSGVWFYAALFRQWLKLATKDNGGFATSMAFRAANRFMAWFASMLLAVVVIIAIGGYVDWLISRPAIMAANAAKLPAPPPSFADATATFFSLKGDVILEAAGGLAFIYFCVVGFWYSGLVFAAWRRTRAARATLPAQPEKAMRTIHRWLSVPFGLYMIVIAVTGMNAISGLWKGEFLPWLSSRSHLENLKRDAEEVRIQALPPELREAAQAQAQAQSGRAGNAGRGGRTGNAGPAARQANAGAPRGLPLYGRITQYLVHQLHTGAVFGKPGQIFVLFTGLALAAFSLSGIWMYVTMYFPRRESGRKALFWH